MDRGDYIEAEEMLNSAEEIKRDLGDLAGLAYTIGNKARLNYLKENYSKSLELHQEEGMLHKQLTNYAELAECLGNQARIYRHLGEFDRAIRLHKEEENYCIRSGFRPGLINCFYKRAQTYIEMGRLLDAKEDIKKALELAYMLKDGRISELRKLKETIHALDHTVD